MCSPIAVPEIKKIVRSVYYPDMKKISEKALTFTTGKEVQEYARAKLKELVPDIALELME